MREFLKLTGAVAALFVAVTANAENRKWNFTNWSSTTVENLKTGSDWSDIEKADGTAPTELSKEKCFWEVTASGTADGTELTANGQPIAELKGLLYTNTTSRSLAIAVDYGDLSSTGSGFSPYHGPSYLWLGSNKKNYFIIPSVKAGAIIKMGVESHKQTDARGVNLYVGHGTSGTQLKSPEGETVPAPKEYTEQEWLVPTDLADTPNDDGTYDIQIYNTNGCHLYYIEVQEGGPSSEEVQVAYLYDTGCQGYSHENDDHVAVLNDLGNVIEKNKVTEIDINNNAELTRDSLLFYDVVVLSRAINPANPFVSSIKEAIAYVPMLNTSTGLYEAWGYGKAVASGTGTITVSEDVKEQKLFNDVEWSGNDVVIYEENEIIGYSAEPGTYFANDAVWAKAGDVNAIHVHNADRNAYMLLPYTYGRDDISLDNEYILMNAIGMLAETKNEVMNTLKPSVNQEFHNQSTTVTLTCSNKDAAIYYTIDGSEPQIGGQQYSEPFEITTTGVVVKAIAKADGYLVSDMTTTEIEIHELAKVPTITYDQKDGYTEITLTPANRGEYVYYNFTGSNTIAQSEVYTDQPITLTKHATITAFTAATEILLQSETVSENIPVLNEKVRLDVVSHFDANKADYNPSSDATYYYNGKSGHSYWSETLIGDYKEDPESGENISDYEPLGDVRYINPGKGWEIRTAGQVMIWQNLNPTHNVGDAGGYNPQTAFDDDLNATQNNVQFGGTGAANAAGKKNPSFTGSIQSTEAFQGPFDLVSNIATTADIKINEETGELKELDIRAYVTTDTLSGEWTELGRLKAGTKKRLWKHTVLGYEGTDKVFVKVCAGSGAAVFDLFIMNSGELSEAYTGIKDVTTGKEAEGQVVSTLIYSVNGTLLDKAARGINIVKEIYANGAVKTRKVMVK